MSQQPQRGHIRVNDVRYARGSKRAKAQCRNVIRGMRQQAKRDLKEGKVPDRIGSFGWLT